MNDFLSITAHRQIQWQTFLVGELVEDVCNSFGSQFETSLVDLEIDVPPHTLLTADPQMIRQLLTELVRRAIRNMPEGGSLVITSYDSDDGFELEVADSGPGLSDQDVAQLYTPSARGRDENRGGLTVVQEIAQAHGGSVTAINCPEGGTALTIKIPRRALGAAA